MLHSKNAGVKFRRQGVIGQYIVDFVCFERKLLIEVDGSQHADSDDDRVRDEWLKSLGYEVLRFWNNDVLGKRDAVMEKIVRYLKNPLPNPPRKGEGISGNKMLSKQRI